LASLQNHYDALEPMTREAFKTALLDSLRKNRSVVLVMLAYIAFALVLGRLGGFDVSLQMYSEPALVLFAVSFCFGIIPIVLLQLHRHRPASPIRFSWHLILNDLRIVERGILALPCIVLFLVFSPAFTSIKSAIGHLHPYRFDPLFAQWDSIIHGGHAWELIHPLVAFPIVTFLLNVLYNLWLPVVLLTFALVTVMLSNARLREQYLLSFLGCWIVIGSLAAIGFSSAGPCFYGLLHPTDPYAPLMSYLRSVDDVYPVWALGTQDMLWDRYTANSTGLGSGISAMPSVHVALTTLNAILLSRLSRIAGILGWLYVLVILIGSVHLGWHYAIDGYASIAAVLLIWWAAGCWATRSTEPAPVPVASS
jgi:hypothetical protein